MFLTLNILPDSPLPALYFTAPSLPFTTKQSCCRLQSRLNSTTVGYNTDTLVKGKYNLISLPFSAVDGGNSTLKAAMSGSWFGGETSDDGDILRVWDAATEVYTVYYYYTDDSHEWDGWYDAGGSYYFDDCAENAGGIEPGWTAWYLSRGTANPTVTMAGAIPPEDDISFTIYGGGYTMIANPFPIAFQPNTAAQVNWGDIHAGETSDDGDVIRIWDASSEVYNVYYYYADESHKWDGWYDAGGSYYFEDLVPDGIPAGQPFWYLSRDPKGTNHTVKFFNPTK